MPQRALIQEIATRRMLLGDEAVALGAAHSGISGAYAYPGTPSTEILEFLIGLAAEHRTPRATWCANEKTAYEQALGMSMAGKRAIVAMKHVGLNVAADPFVSSAIASTVGGLVVAVADDPGMHSSQTEQDSRYYADFAHLPCLEPATPQEAYLMTREAFDLSERVQKPVLLRLVTRLAHNRAPVEPAAPMPENELRKVEDPGGWVLLPVFARAQWRDLLSRQAEFRAWAEGSPHNALRLREPRTFGVITTGVARNYFFERLGEFRARPSHLHVGAYPMPLEKIRALAAHVDTILVIEEGYPYVERYLRGIVPVPVRIRGKETGDLPLDGELTPDTVAAALGLEVGVSMESELAPLPPRPPRLCDGCPHRDAYEALNQALAGYATRLVTSDIGCYTLGVLPPYQIGESCICMGASIGMAKGAAEAGMRPVVAVIGDSTFLHSGVTPLMDAAAADTDMTVLVLDNQTVAMTGLQPTVLPSNELRHLALGVGVHPDHCVAYDSHPRRIPELVEILRREIAHPGLSVVISHRECLEAARKRKSGRATGGHGRAAAAAPPGSSSDARDPRS